MNLLTILGLLAALFVVCVVLIDTFETPAIFGALLAGGAFFLLSIIWLTSYTSNLTSIETHFAIREELATRNNTISISEHALILDIMRSNEWVTYAQYRNNDSNAFSYFIPDEVMELEPLQYNLKEE